MKPYDDALDAIDAGRANGTAVIAPITFFDWQRNLELMRKLVDAEPRDVTFRDMFPMEAMANESFLWYVGQMENLRKLSLTTTAEDRPVVRLNELPASCESVDLTRFQVEAYALPRVKHVSLTECLVSNDVIEALKGNQTMESLKMTRYDVKERGYHVRELLKVVATTKIGNLKFTVFDEWDVQDAHNLLWKCKGLKTVSLYVEAEGELVVNGIMNALLALARTRMYLGVALDAIELEFKETVDAYVTPGLEHRQLRFIINALEKRGTRLTLLNGPDIVTRLTANYEDLDEAFIGPVLKDLTLESDGED